MWNAITAPCLFLLCFICLATGCTLPQLPDEKPVRTVRLLLPPLGPLEKVTMDTVMIGNVGKPIGRDYYAIPIEFLEPAQLRCRVTSRPLWSESSAPPTEAALNVWLNGPGTEHVACTEVPLLRSKELSCSVTKKGGYSLTFQSASPGLAAGFGFICSQQLLKLDVPTPITSPVSPVHQIPRGSRAPATSPGPIKEPAAGKLVLRLDRVNDGSDDKHKILKLVPCAEPLKAAGGSIKIGKSSSRRYIVHKSKTCEVEVGDVPDDLLQDDTPVTLTP